MSEMWGPTSEGIGLDARTPPNNSGLTNRDTRQRVSQLATQTQPKKGNTHENIPQTHPAGTCTCRCSSRHPPKSSLSIPDHHTLPMAPGKHHRVNSQASSQPPAKCTQKDDDDGDYIPPQAPAPVPKRHYETCKGNDPHPGWTAGHYKRLQLKVTAGADAKRVAHLEKARAREEKQLEKQAAMAEKMQHTQETSQHRSNGVAKIAKLLNQCQRDDNKLDAETDAPGGNSLDSEDEFDPSVNGPA